MTALLLALALVAGPQSTELKRARDRFEYGAWAEAAGTIRGWLAEHPDVTGDDAVEAYRMLGIAELKLGDSGQARAAFVSLLSLDPDQQLDPFLVEPRIVDFFDQVRRELEPALAPLRERRRALEEQRRLADDAKRRLFSDEQARSGAPAKVIKVEERLYLFNWMPFGAGQFQNGQPAKGTAIAAAELMLLVANLGAILYHSQAAQDLTRRCATVSSICSRPPYTDALRDDLRTADLVKYVSAGLFWAVYAYGVLDAHHYFVPRVETEISPQEAAVKLSWRF